MRGGRWYAAIGHLVVAAVPLTTAMHCTEFSKRLSADTAVEMIGGSDTYSPMCRSCYHGLEAPRQRGRVELVVGPMFSGKSTELLRRIRRYRYARKQCLYVVAWHGLEGALFDRGVCGGDGAGSSSTRRTRGTAPYVLLVHLPHFVRPTSRVFADNHRTVSPPTTVSC